ncbi:MAG TPA: nucleotidyltransferase family protein [Burkholderiaceae bacterium]|nr:nucleotidyltransferase family protein [Burkholderiaceae bacterium]
MVKALILAAGRGERLRPLTDKHPKPMLKVHGIPLMQWAMRALGLGGVTKLVVNTAWLGHQIEDYFSSQYIDVFSHETAYLLPSMLSKSEQKPEIKYLYTLQYSHEGIDFGGALETAGGIVRALPMLCSADENDIFWVLAGDVYAPNFSFSQESVEKFKTSNKLAHIWLVPNPEHNSQGDFGLQDDGLALNDSDANGQKYTFSTIALYRKSFFSLPYCDIAEGNPSGIKAALAPLLRKAISEHKVSAELYTGTWVDVGTPERLRLLNNEPLL